MRPLLRRRLLFVPLLLFAASACRFERRPELRPSADTLPPADSLVRVSSGAAAEDSVRAVVDAFRDALVVGDASRVASLSVPGALLVDQEEGVRWRWDAETGASGALPGVLTDRRAGLGWMRESSEVATFDDAALIVDRYRATVSGEDVPWTAVETHVLVRTPEGWRLRHLHRSRGQGFGVAPGVQP